MCTVTFVPTRDGFYLTSNRDENVNRGKALSPEFHRQGNNNLLFPRDPDKKGTWISAKDNGDIAVLLNGAFVKHNRKNSYRKSRGLILLEVIQAASPIRYIKELSLADIEPFTLVLYTNGNLYECRWDGSKKYIVSISPQMPHIWSSATLYNSRAASQREEWFKNWLNSYKNDETKNIRAFHMNAGKEDPENGLVINRDGLMKTVSVTSVLVRPRSLTMHYLDLQDDSAFDKHLVLKINREKQKKQAGTRFLKIRAFLIRLLNWEYWPFNVVYLPIMPYWFWLGLKARSLFFFTTSNPLIENGGFAMESKKRIYDLIPQRYYPKTIYVEVGTNHRKIIDGIREAGLEFPLIAKPDIGGRGVQVKLVRDEGQLTEYVRMIRVDFLLQAYVPYKNEVGVFYCRMPGEPKGRVTGIVGKEFLTITGDGVSTVEQLLAKNPRYLLQLSTLKQTEPCQLPNVLPSGKPLTLVPYGNHARGAKFIDFSHLISEKLNASFDEVCQQIPEFYFGRMDIMYDCWDEFAQGKNFSIIELNGAGSEPTHIYDPSHSIFFAWKEIIRHWKLLFEISRKNHQLQKIPFMSFKDGMGLLRKEKAYRKLTA